MAAPSRWSCPSEDTLYRFSTGDASRWQRARVRRHVDRCDACAARLDEWEAATVAYRDYVSGEAHDREQRACVTRFQARLRREPSPAPPPSLRALAWPRQLRTPIGWRSIAAAVVLVAGGLAGFLPLQETITADALVARAVANDRQCPCPRADMVTIAASPHRGRAQAMPAGLSTVTSTPGPMSERGQHARERVESLGTSANTSTNALTSGSTPRRLMSERGAHARELAERLAEYSFDWQVPLSARPYQEWRSAITARTESYDWIASDRVRVSTRAASGRIQRAELILRTTDYRPVGQTWLFADGFAVELRLFEREAPAAPSVPPPALNRIAEASGAPAAPVSRTIEETEIALRVSLERAGVVLTRRLALRRSGERLTIAGRAASRDVRRIAASAREIGDIGVEVRAEAGRNSASNSSASSGGTSSGSTSSGSTSSGSTSTGFDAWLERTFGDNRSRAAFLPAARELCDNLADAVAALDGLSLRFPASAADARLSAYARDDVRWLTAAYYARVTASYERLEAHLAPLTGSVSRRVLTATPSSHWRTTSAALTPAMRALSEELAALAAPSSASSLSISIMPSSSTVGATADAPADLFERTAGARVREKLVAVVPR